MPYNFAADSLHTGVTAETLRAKIERKSTMSLKRGHFDPKFPVMGINYSKSSLTTITFSITY